MADFLSDEYLADAEQRAASVGAHGSSDVIVRYVVSGAPAGKVQFTAVIEGGAVTSVSSVTDADPDITVTLTAPAAQALLAGETTADESYMRGTVKIEGDHVMWLLGLRELRAAVLDALAG